MQRIFLYILFCFTVLQTRAQQQIVQRFYENTVPGQLLKTNNGNYILTGGQFVPSINREMAFFSVLDSVGNINYQTFYSLSGYHLSIFKSIFTSNNSIVHLCYIRELTTFNPIGIAFIKTDLSGNILLNKVFYASGQIKVCDFAYSSGNITFCGAIDYGYVTTPTFYYHNLRFLIFQTDDNLNLNWAKEYHNKIKEAFYEIVATSDGGNIVQGISYDSVPTPARLDLVTMKFDASGNIVWARQAGSPTFPPQGMTGVLTGKIREFNNGDILNAFSCIWYTGLINGSYDIILQKLDSSGNEIASYRYGDNSYGTENLRDIIIDDNQNILFTSLGLHIKARTDLTPIWVKNNMLSNINQGSYFGFYSLIHNPDDSYSGIAHTGKSVQNFPPNINRICFMKTDSTGTGVCQPWPPYYLYMQPEQVGNFNIISQLSSYPFNLSDSSISLTPYVYTMHDSVNCLSYSLLNENDFSTVKVLPTVFSNHIQIQLSQKPDNNWSYSLYAINGKMITSQKLVEDITISDFSSLSEGIYFLQVKSKNDSKYFKIIKQ